MTKIAGEMAPAIILNGRCTPQDESATAGHQEKHPQTAARVSTIVSSHASRHTDAQDEHDRDCRLRDERVRRRVTSGERVQRPI